jgi:hypothetical protein
MGKLAWLWQQYQLASAQVSGFRERISGTGRRMRKVMVVALARKLLVACGGSLPKALSRLRDQEVGVKD